MSRLRDNPDGPSRHRARMGANVVARLEKTPGVRRAPTASAEIFQFPAFLACDECDVLLPLIDSDLRPSAVFAEGDWAAEYRSSETCDLPGATAIDARIAALLGIPEENGETLQGQRYLPGQHFRAHCDWFEGTQAYWPAMLEQGGQRTWTAMVYLNDVEEGGATWFPRAGVRFRPRAGLLIAWNNMRPDGSPNPGAIHEGMRVSAGAKYILTKWFRESAWSNTGQRAY